MHSLEHLEQQHVFLEDKYISIIDVKVIYEVAIPEQVYKAGILLTIGKRNYQGRNSKTPLIKRYFLAIE